MATGKPLDLFLGVEVDLPLALWVFLVSVVCGSLICSGIQYVGEIVENHIILVIASMELCIKFVPFLVVTNW